jgi:subtilisin family serine protease
VQAPEQQTSDNDNEQAATTELVIKTSNPEEVLALAAGQRLDITGNTALPGGVQLITMRVADEEEISRDLASIAGTVSGENITYRMLATPNDPIYPQTYTDTISAPAAWDITTGSPAVKVAVLDTGYALNHEDLTAQWLTNPGETGAGKETNGVDDDSNGLIDDWRGWDFHANDNDPGATSIGHGTQVAGLVGATGNNSKGVASLNWNVSILPIKVLSDGGTGTTASLISGLAYARSLGVHVVNMSLGGSSPDSLLEAEINADIAAGIAVIAAAGNCGDPSTYVLNGCDFVGQVMYPANYGQVLSVGATNLSDSRASFSSYGGNLDIMAPGSGAIRTPTISGGNTTTAYTNSVNGTSYASPVVAGLAALIKARLPDADHAQLAGLIILNADKVAGMGGQDRTDFYGFGRINALRSLTVYQWALEDISHSSSTAVMDAGQTQTITIKARNTGTATWQQSGDFPVRLGTWPPQRGSAVAHGSWLSSVRPAQLQEASVEPGDIGTFVFTVRGPFGGDFFERVNLVAEGQAWFNDPGALFYLRVLDDFRWEVLWHAHSTGTALINRDTNFELVVKVRNTGSTTWHQTGDFPVRLGTEAPKNRGSGLYHDSWIRDFRPAALVEASVPPGGVGTFVFTARTPSTPGERFEQFNLVAENIKWFTDIGFQIYVKVL